jgi:chemosensory pili system protein ChpA (sensor histidine kinase/response regulator)
MADRRERELLLGIFLMEAWDTAGVLEEGLGVLGGPNAPTAETLAPLVVSAHRLKGSAALHGFPGVSDLAAGTERLLERAPAVSPEERARGAAFLDGLVGLLKEVFDAISAVGVEDTARIGEFKARYPAFFAIARPAAPAASISSPVSRLAIDLRRFFTEGGEVLEYFLPEAAEHLEAMTSGLLTIEGGARDEDTLATVFRAAHTLKGAAYTVGCVPLGDATHQIEDLLVAVRERRVSLAPAVTESLFAGVEAIKLVLQTGAAVSDETAQALERATLALRSLTASEALPAPAEASGVAVELAEPVAAAEPTGLASLPGFVRPEFMARLEALPRPSLRAEPALPAGPSIRVPVERLDTLMNLVGELMIARSHLDRRMAQLDQVSELLLASRTRLGQVGRDFEFRRRVPTDTGHGHREESDGAEMRDISELFAELEFDRYDDINILARSVTEMSADVAEVQSQHATLLRAVQEDTVHIQRLVTALRKEVTRARMVPIGRLFTRVAHQVREVSRATGKMVTLSVRGESVEVDNGIIEQIGESLLHLIQNAVAHGIEPAAERESRGKSAQGQVTLSAAQEGAFIVVEVEDDGRGIDVDLLRRRAAERGLLPPAEAAGLPDREALNLMFVSGFSTASAVTQTAGRGVGLDVVRTNVSRLNGEIHVETEPGRMTRFVLRLPLTVVIADAVLVRCGSETLAVPLTAVSAMRSVAPHEVLLAAGRETVQLDDRVLDLVRLDQVLGLSAVAPSTRLPVVVMRGGGRPFGLAVDALLGKEEIVIKGLGALLEGVGPFSGATISGEGRVILLLDPARLREAATLRPPVAAPEPGRSPIDARPTVLLVDDSISVRKFVGQMLEKAGFRVATAVDGQDALQQLLDLTVDVVVTDLEMPRVNGYALIEDLRRRAATREVPVVVMTTRAGDKHVGLARRLGVRHYVTKPVDEQHFVRLVGSVVAGEPAVAASVSGSLVE